MAEKIFRDTSKQITRAAQREAKGFFGFLPFLATTAVVIYLAWWAVTSAIVGISSLHIGQSSSNRGGGVIAMSDPVSEAAPVQAPTATPLPTYIVQATVNSLDVQATQAALSVRATAAAIDNNIAQAQIDLQRKQSEFVSSQQPSFWGWFIPALVVLLTFVALGGFVSYVFAYLRQNKAKAATLKPDMLGNYEVRLLDNGGVVQPTPGNASVFAPVSSHYSPSITFSPTTTYKEPTQALNAPVVDNIPTLDTGIVDGEIITAPPFAELMERGMLGFGKPLLLAYSEGQPLNGTWKDIYSAAIGGISGTGKTTTVRFLAAQSALSGGKFLIIDPHAGAGDESLAETLAPLSSAFVCNPASDDDEIEAALFVAQSELRKRLADKTAPRYPFIVAVDEFTSLMRRSEVAKPLSQLLQDISQEGRKVGVFALCMGQIWKGSTSGGTELRDSFASAYVHRMKRNQARMLLPTDEAAQVERLAIGTAVLYRTNGDLLPVSIPLTTGSDIERVAGMLEVNYKSDVSRSEVSQEVTSNPPLTAKLAINTLSADETRILSLFRDGATIADIVKQLHGPQAGRNLQLRNQEVQEVLRRSLSQV